MKILYLMNHVDQGGAALALFDLIQEIKKDGVVTPVVITGKKNRLNSMLNEIDVENYSADFKNFMSSYKRPVAIYKFLLEIRYTIGKKRALSEIEKLIDFSTIDIIHSNLNRIDMGAILSKKYVKPHIWHIREHLSGGFRLVSIKRNPIEYINSFDSYHVLISKSVERAWGNKGLALDKARMIYDGVRTELYDVHYNTCNKKIRMIFLGGYTESKGQEELLDALSNLSQDQKKLFSIDFYGNGDKKYVRYLKRKVIESGIDSCVALYPYDNEIKDKILEYDVGLTCSRAEGFGRATVEYMLSGLCPIVSDSGANSELVTAHRTGIIYSSGDKKDLLEKVLWAAENRKDIERMGLDACAFAKEHFSMKKHAEEVIKLYQEIMDGVG